MTGITIDELINEWLAYNHSAEFEYKGVPYSIEPITENNKSFLTIWKCQEPPHCLYKHSIPINGKVPIDNIRKTLSAKCFDGKSFLEVEKDINVTAIQ